MSFVECGGAVHFFERRQPSAHAGREPPPALVFINGLGTDYRIWDGVVERLAPELPVVRYDLRGHGASEVGAGAFSVERFANDLAQLIERLELPRFVLCGLSLGGLVAQCHALRADARLCGVVLCATAARIGSRELWEERGRAIAASGLEGAAEAIVSRWFSPQFIERHPEPVRGHRSVLERMPAAGYRSSLEALASADLRADVGRIGVPALVLAGERDVATPPELVRELARAIPKARFEIIAGAGHLLPVEEPGLVAHHLQHFLREHDLV